MPPMDIVFTQILVILLYVLVGFAAGKSGLIDPGQRKYLTRICTDLIMPFTIFSASSQSLTRGEILGLGVAVCAVFGVLLLSEVLSLTALKALRVPDKVRVTAASLVTFPNFTFLGLPLCRALFGDIAVLYNAVGIVAFNALFFTVQYSMFTGNKFRLKNLLTLPTVCTFAVIVMLILGLQFPAPVRTVVGNIGAMISPLSLMIVGVMMSESRIGEVLKEKRAYLAALFRNLLIPLLSIPLLKVLPFTPASRCCLLVFLSCPCATLTTIYAIQSDSEPELAARGVLLSTILFAATLPLIILAGNAFLA